MAGEERCDRTTTISDPLLVQRHIKRDPLYRKSHLDRLGESSLFSHRQHLTIVQPSGILRIAEDSANRLRHRQESSLRFLLRRKSPAFSRRERA